MKKLLVGGVGLLALATAMQPALAADLPVRKAPLAPVYGYSWTGCYFGGHFGGVWITKDYDLRSVGTAIGGIVFDTPIGFGSHDANGWLGGLQGGCNYQFAGGFVIGIQGDYAWMDAEGSHAGPFGGVTSLQSNVKSLASITGRIGYAWDRFLGYVKGGGAWERDEYLWYVTAAPGLSTSASETRSGWTIGVGGEYAFSDWLTGFVEYNYYDFGTSTVAFPVGPLDFNFDIEERKSVIKAGLNFKFGGKGPVAARY